MLRVEVISSLGGGIQSQAVLDFQQIWQLCSSN